MATVTIKMAFSAWTKIAEACTLNTIAVYQALVSLAAQVKEADAIQEHLTEMADLFVFGNFNTEEAEASRVDFCQRDGVESVVICVYNMQVILSFEDCGKLTIQSCGAVPLDHILNTRKASGYTKPSNPTNSFTRSLAIKDAASKAKTTALRGTYIQVAKQLATQKNFHLMVAVLEKLAISSLMMTHIKGMMKSGQPMYAFECDGNIILKGWVGKHPASLKLTFVMAK